MHTKPQLSIWAILISGVKFPPPTHRTHLFQSCCLDLIIIFKRWCYVPILHLFIDITWRKRKNSCFLREFWHILTVCKLRYSKSRQWCINLGMWVVMVCCLFLTPCDNDYDRNWRNNWGKGGGDTDFYTYQSEDYFWKPVFKTLVTVAPVISENPSVFPGVFLTQNSWKTVLAVCRFSYTALTAELHLSPWNAEGRYCYSWWMPNKWNKTVMFALLQWLPVYEILTK